MCVYEKLKELGLTLPPHPPKGGIYAPVKAFGDKLYYVSGNGPHLGDKRYKTGKLGAELTVEEGVEAARNCTLNILSCIHAHLGDLNQIQSIVKILGFVASMADFYEQPKVMNGASALLEEIFGTEIGVAARSAIGTNVLPGNIPVEVELLFEIK